MDPKYFVEAMVKMAYNQAIENINLDTEMAQVSKVNKAQPKLKDAAFEKALAGQMKKDKANIIEDVRKSNEYDPKGKPSNEIRKQPRKNMYASNKPNPSSVGQDVHMTKQEQRDFANPATKSFPVASNLKPVYNPSKTMLASK